MGKRRNRNRGHRHDQNHASVTDEKTPPVLRLVRDEGPDLPRQQDAAGQPDSAIVAIPEPDGRGGVGETGAVGTVVDTGVDTGLDDVPGELVTRSFTAADINPILNDPSVFPLVTVPGLEYIDVTNIVEDPRNVLLMTNGGGILFAWQELGRYHVHTAFLTEHRGKNALRCSLAAYRWMFTHTDCLALFTTVPAHNPGAENFCKLVGATKEFERKAVWPTANGVVDMSFWSLRYDDWVRQTPSLKKSGQRFHARLVEEKQRHGKSEPQHLDEDCHDLHVGVCAEMIYGGQLDKAVVLYNRWASFAGYGSIALVSRSPAMIDIGEALLQITGDTFKVALCR